MSSVQIQITHPSTDIPNESDIDDWIRKTLNHTRNQHSEITVRIVNTDEITALNQKYRGQDRPTDVLSFPIDLPPGMQLNVLGDVVVCANAVNQYLTANRLPYLAHWARVIVHGILHLCGYDHAESRQAERMESTEFQILQQLNLEHPDLNSAYAE